MARVRQAEAIHLSGQDRTNALYRLAGDILRADVPRGHFKIIAANIRVWCGLPGLWAVGQGKLPPSDIREDDVAVSVEHGHVVDE